MRTARMRAPAASSFRAARGRSEKKGRPVPGHRLRGLRWVPVPLALLAVAMGLLVMGSRQGQAAADLASHPNEAGGLSLSVDTMLWMSNDVDGSGAPASANGPGQAAAAPAPGDASQFQMPDSMMPGMQTTGEDRLRIEVDLSNVAGKVEQYNTTDFTLTGPGGKTWQVNGQEHSSQPASANLQPGFATTVDLYFDIQASAIKNLTLHWSRGGRTISMPVNTGGQAPAGMHM
jgi:hypothetical protein